MYIYLCIYHFVQIFYAVIASDLQLNMSLYFHAHLRYDSGLCRPNHSCIKCNYILAEIN